VRQLNKYGFRKEGRKREVAKKEKGSFSPLTLSFCSLGRKRDFL